jgi:putative nucleotidyltransferase-like protein
MSVQLPTCGYFHRAVRHRDAFNALIDTMKVTVAALRDADVQFMLGGSMAAWARGGPEPDNDLDLMVSPDHAEAALEALARAGMKIERPPEEWLYKAWHGEVLIDLIFCPSGLELTDEVFARGETISVMALTTPVMALEDVLVTMLYALDEHALDYSRLLAITRALREQINWPALRRRASGSPYAKAFITLVEELDIAPGHARTREAGAGEGRARVRVVGATE